MRWVVLSGLLSVDESVSTIKYSPRLQAANVPPRASHLLPAKHLQTEQLMTRHTLKTRFSRYQLFIDRALSLIQSDIACNMIEVLLACLTQRAQTRHKCVGFHNGGKAYGQGVGGAARWSRSRLHVVRLPPRNRLVSFGVNERHESTRHI